MREPEPRKWITWEIPQKYLIDTPDKNIEKLTEHLNEEVSKAIEDMLHGIPISMKITNLPKEY
jgi:hypothetical protein